MNRAAFASLAGCSLAFTFACSTPAQGQTLTDPPETRPIEATALVPAAPVAPTFTIRNLFADTISDFRRLPSRETFLLLGIGATAALIGHGEDASVTRAFSSATDLHEPLEPGAIIGGTPFQLGAAVATYTIGRISGQSRVVSVGADLIQAQLVAEATTAAIKFAAGRTRPDGTPRSFPSGHASVTFASATVLQRHFGWKVGIPAYAVASYVAASRIQMQKHYLSDVAFGAALGIIAGRTVTIGRGDARFALAPMAAPGGGGAGFTWLGKR
jgi:membrane-associated phospholipid phosphatase